MAKPQKDYAFITQYKFVNFRSKCNGRVDDVGSLGRLRCNMQKIPFNLKHQALLLQARLSKGQIMSKEKKHNFCLNIRYRNSSCRGICKTIGIKRLDHSVIPPAVKTPDCNFA